MVSRGQEQILQIRDGAKERLHVVLLRYQDR